MWIIICFLLSLLCFPLSVWDRPHRLKTLSTKSSRRWTHAKMWWRTGWARSKRSSRCCRRRWKPCRKPYRATCRCWPTRPVSSSSSSHPVRRTLPPAAAKYNDDSNFFTLNRRSAAALEALAPARQPAALAELLTRDLRPVPGRLRPVLPRRPRLRRRRKRRRSRRRCHPSPNLANSCLSISFLISLYLSNSLSFPFTHSLSFSLVLYDITSILLPKSPLYQNAPSPFSLYI